MVPGNLNLDLVMIEHRYNGSFTLPRLRRLIRLREEKGQDFAFSDGIDLGYFNKFEVRPTKIEMGR